MIPAAACIIYFMRKISFSSSQGALNLHIPNRRQTAKEIRKRIIIKMFALHREIKKARLIFVSRVTAIRTWISAKKFGYFFAGYFPDEQGENNSGSRKNNNQPYLRGCNDNSASIVLKTFRKGTSHFQITPSVRAYDGKSQGSDEARAHFNQALIELKTRILLREPKFRGIAAVAPPTDVILQVLRAQKYA